MLLRNGYGRDSQIMFGAIGDVSCDRVPLQIGQFEKTVLAEAEPKTRDITATQPFCGAASVRQNVAVFKVVAPAAHA